jgi:hypothetical protein
MPAKVDTLDSPFDYLPGCYYPRGSSLNQAPADTCTVAYGEQVGYLGLQVLGELEARLVELDLGAVEESIGRGYTRSKFIHGGEHFVDSLQEAIREHIAKVTRSGTL